MMAQGVIPPVSGSIEVLLTKGTEMAATKSKSDNKPSTPKAAPKKAESTTAKKPVAAKAPAKKPAAAKKTDAPKHKISPEERYRMVEVAAYFLAERNAYGCSPVQYLTAAEIQIAKLLKK
jgi:hypothetical protein